MMPQESLLNIRNLSISIRRDDHTQEIVSGLNLEIKSSKIVALVGGSGSGKTTTGLAILGLLSSGFHVTSGEILFQGEDLLKSSPKRLQQIRGKDICMIFQEPLSAFNPLFTLGNQIEETLIFHSDLKRKKRKEKVLELLKTVGVPEPQRIARAYPHQLSGGLRQRAMIALAIATQPKVIIADEPTSNLDVTLQAKMMDLFRKLRQEMKVSILLITHDLGLVSHLADDVAILYSGKIVERGVAQEVFVQPQHPFTEQLVKAVTS